MQYDKFWDLTPNALFDIIYSNSERIKQDLALRDITNWQLGQYMQAALSEALAGAFGKKADIYPKEPMFSKNYIERQKDQEQLTMAQKELETMKFKDFFSNLGNYVAIKKKGGMNGKE